MSQGEYSGVVVKVEQEEVVVKVEEDDRVVIKMENGDKVVVKREGCDEIVVKLEGFEEEGYEEVIVKEEESDSEWEDDDGDEPWFWPEDEEDTDDEDDEEEEYARGTPKKKRKEALEEKESEGKVEGDDAREISKTKGKEASKKESGAKAEKGQVAAGKSKKSDKKKAKDILKKGGGAWEEKKKDAVGTAKKHQKKKIKEKVREKESDDSEDEWEDEDVKDTPKKKTNIARCGQLKLDGTPSIIPPSRSGRGKHDPTYKDGLVPRQRNRLRNEKKYVRYMAEFKAGNVQNMEEFRILDNIDATSFEFMRGRKQDPELTPYQGRVKRAKERSKMLMERGIPADKTPYGKVQAYIKEWATHESRTQCQYCGTRMTQRSVVLRHIRRVHQHCANMLAPLEIDERRRIEEDTRLAADRGPWRWVRKGRITSTRAGAIYRRKTADPHRMAFKMNHISGRGYESPAMKRGKRLEPLAVKRYMEKYGITEYQYPVGFCIYPKNGFMGATPDGLIGKDGVVEVKCPVVPIMDVSTRKGDKFLVEADDGPRGLKLKRAHRYFDQVVMEIICTDRQYCDFVVYYENDENPSEWDIWVERITREEADQAWKVREPVLTDFYHRYLGPPVLAPKP